MRSRGLAEHGGGDPIGPPWQWTDRNNEQGDYLAKRGLLDSIAKLFKDDDQYGINLKFDSDNEHAEAHFDTEFIAGCGSRTASCARGRPPAHGLGSASPRSTARTGSAARTRGGRRGCFLDDVRRKFKDDNRARKCKQKDGYTDFTPVCETYTACRS